MKINVVNHLYWFIYAWYPINVICLCLIYFKSTLTLSFITSLILSFNLSLILLPFHKTIINVLYINVFVFSILHVIFYSFTTNFNKLVIVSGVVTFILAWFNFVSKYDILFKLVLISVFIHGYGENSIFWKFTLTPLLVNFLYNIYTNTVFNQKTILLKSEICTTITEIKLYKKGFIHDFNQYVDVKLNGGSNTTKGIIVSTPGESDYVNIIIPDTIEITRIKISQPKYNYENIFDKFLIIKSIVVFVENDYIITVLSLLKQYNIKINLYWITNDYTKFIHEIKLLSRQHSIKIYITNPNFENTANFINCCYNNPDYGIIKTEHINQTLLISGSKNFTKLIRYSK